MKEKKSGNFFLKNIHEYVYGEYNMVYNKYQGGDTRKWSKQLTNIVIG